MSTLQAVAVRQRVPRLGFLGVGWIGRNRMQALAASGAGAVTAIADANTERAAEARSIAPDAAAVDSLDALLEMELDGIVIATPSALHAEQCERALTRGFPVFCQKPLARSAQETRHVMELARNADVLLGIDLSYRYTAAMRAVRDVVASGGVGDVFAVDLTFHNAYGPDSGWARDPVLAGGGCVIDLGIHLVDLALWTLGFPRVDRVSSQLYAHGRRLDTGSFHVCEDFATATIELASGTTLRLACSWESSTGRDAVIEAAFHGADGSAAFRNVDGSFYDFTAERRRGSSSETLVAPPDEWGGRALIDWSARLGSGARYDADVESVIDVAATLDAVLGR